MEDSQLQTFDSAVKETSEGDYEEIDNNSPFTMEYNVSYSTVAQAAMYRVADRL